MTEHTLTTNGMGYFWCSCNPHRAHVMWSLNEHLAEIAAEAAETALAGVRALADRWQAEIEPAEDVWDKGWNSSRRGAINELRAVLPPVPTDEPEEGR